MNTEKNYLRLGCDRKATLIMNNRAEQRAFTFVELLALIAVVAFCAVMVLPAMARTRTNSGVTQCLNNLKRLGSAWAMYSSENNGALVAAYPSFGGFSGSWCKGNASSNGGAGAYVYGGADPAGITNGLLWPYVKSFNPYKCPFDKRLAAAGNPFAGQPILRTVSMNSYMAGANFGTASAFNVANGGAQDPNAPVFLKENQIPRPSSIFVFIDEDPKGIDDCMFLVDMGGGNQFINLPSRLHGFGINFADTHVELRQLRDPESFSWGPGQLGGINDWRALTNVTTAPVN